MNFKFQSINYKNNTLKNFKNIYEAINGTYALIFLTEWQEYTKINWNKAVKIIRIPVWVLMRDMLRNQEDIQKVGINLWRIIDGVH